MHGVTVVITNDIAAIPLLWVIPLGLYLLTFILAFANNRLYPARAIIYSAPFVPLLILIPMLWMPQNESYILLFCHIFAVFVISLACHTLLHEDRPKAQDLSAFYLWLAFGGMLGGIFNAIAAPYLFDRFIEYPLTFAGAGALIVWRVISTDTKLAKPTSNRLWRHLAVITIVIVIGLALIYILRSATGGMEESQQQELYFLIACLGIVMFAVSWRSPLGTFASVMILFAVVPGVRESVNIYVRDLVVNDMDQTPVMVSRNYYGMIRLFRVDLPARPADHQYLYYNGLILHGAYTPQENPGAYYKNDGFYGPIYQHAKKIGKSVANLGLGTGRDKCYQTQDQHTDFYEINPAVIKMAQGLGALTNCPGTHSMYEGDARLSLRDRSPGEYGAIISTMTHSSTVPFHLMTKQAIELYLNKLAPGGTLLFLTPANFIDFRPLYRRYSEIFDVPIYSFFRNNQQGYRFRYFLIVKPPLKFEDIGYPKGNWEKVEPCDSCAHAWRDDYYSILGMLKY